MPYFNYQYQFMMYYTYIMYSILYEKSNKTSIDNGSKETNKYLSSIYLSNYHQVGLKCDFFASLK